MRRIGTFVTLTVLLAAPGAVADEAAPEQTRVEVPEPVAFVTEHTGTFNGAEVGYVARAGETYLLDDAGEPKASIFSFAYTKNGAGDPAERPVMFLWNGGPGSASLWLHMGAFGPKRVVVPSDAASAGAPPWPLVDSSLTLLDVTDLVFVDPVGTGFSRPLGGHEGAEFWGLDEDAASVAEFIRQWLSDNGRWSSPKLIAGESFGTVRAAAVAHLLEKRLGIRLNGVVLIAQALDYQGSTPVDDNLVAHVTYLPTMAATAAYHGKVAPPDGDLEAFLRQARDFAAEELAPALIKGSALDASERARVRDRLAWFTGLDPEYVERADLRVTATRFRKELLRDQGLSVGRADGRYTRDDLDDTADSPDGDAASDGYKSAFVAAVNDYIRRDLGVALDRPYVHSAEVWKKWSWHAADPEMHREPSYVNVARRLADALRRNADLKVLVASGLYDFATPFYDAEYTLGRHAVPKDRVEYHVYEAGHMMYIHEPSRQELMTDVRRFVESACGG